MPSDSSQNTVPVRTLSNQTLVLQDVHRPLFLLGLFLWSYHKGNSVLGSISAEMYSKSETLFSRFSQLKGYGLEDIPYKDFFQKVDAFPARVKADTREKEKQIIQSSLERSDQSLSQLEICFQSINTSLQEERSKDLAKQVLLTSQLMEVSSYLSLMNTDVEALRDSFQAQRERSLTPVLLEVAAPKAYTFASQLFSADPVKHLFNAMRQKQGNMISTLSIKFLKLAVFNALKNLKELKQMETRIVKTISDRKKRFIQGSIVNAWYQQCNPILEKQDVFFQKKQSRLLQAMYFSAFSQFLGNAKGVHERVNRFDQIKRDSLQRWGISAFSQFLGNAKGVHERVDRLCSKHDVRLQLSGFDAFKEQLKIALQSCLKWQDLIKRYLAFNQTQALKQSVTLIKQNNCQKMSEIQTGMAVFQVELTEIIRNCDEVIKGMTADFAKKPSYFQVALEALSANRLDHPAILAIFLSGNSTSAAASSSDPYEASFYKAFYKRFNFQYPSVITSLRPLLTFYEQLKTFCFTDDPENFPDFASTQKEHYGFVSSIAPVFKKHFSDLSESLTLKDLALFNILLKESDVLQSTLEMVESNEQRLATCANLFLKALKRPILKLPHNLSSPQSNSNLSIQQIADDLGQHLISQFNCLEIFIAKLDLFVKTFFQGLLPDLSSSSALTESSGLPTYRSDASSGISSHTSRNPSGPHLISSRSGTRDWFEAFKTYESSSLQPQSSGPPTGAAWMSSKGGNID